MIAEVQNYILRKCWRQRQRRQLCQCNLTSFDRKTFGWRSNGNATWRRRALYKNPNVVNLEQNPDASFLSHLTFPSCCEISLLAHSWLARKTRKATAKRTFVKKDFPQTSPHNFTRTTFVTASTKTWMNGVDEGQFLVATFSQWARRRRRRRGGPSWWKNWRKNSNNKRNITKEWWHHWKMRETVGYQLVSFATLMPPFLPWEAETTFDISTNSPAGSLSFGAQCLHWFCWL